MRIWLTQVGEQLPIDPGSPRLLRTGLLAEVLAERGHEVRWWASRFDYRNRVQRTHPGDTVAVGPHYQVSLLPSRGFSQNLSVGRVWDNVQVGRAFARAIKLAPAPDLILTSYPSIEISRVAVGYGRRRGIPVVVDVRDLWPDTFLRAVPAGWRRAARLALSPWFIAARDTFRMATAITGITSDIVDWAVSLSRRGRTALDQDFPHGYRPPILTAAQRNSALEFWRGLGVDAGKGEFLVCYLGALSSIVEFETVVAAAELLRDDPRPIRFIFCGTGGREQEMRQRAAHCPNIQFSGLIGAHQIWVLMEMAALGLLCYHSTFDYEASIPNKPIEYMAGGLPTLSSLNRGILRRLLAERQAGLSYVNGQPEQLAALIRRCYDNPREREAMSSAARATFREHFEAGQVYGRMGDYLERIGRDPGLLEAWTGSSEVGRDGG